MGIGSERACDECVRCGSARGGGLLLLFKFILKLPSSTCDGEGVPFEILVVGVVDPEEDPDREGEADRGDDVE